MTLHLIVKRDDWNYYTCVLLWYSQYSRNRVQPPQHAAAHGDLLRRLPTSQSPTVAANPSHRGTLKIDPSPAQHVTLHRHGLHFPRFLSCQPEGTHQAAGPVCRLRRIFGQLPLHVFRRSVRGQ